MPIFIVANNRGLNTPITLSTEDEHHLVRVMRANVAETFFVTDNFGTRGDVVIESVKPLCLSLKTKTEMARPKPITVALPLIDPERLEWAVEKLTEINCAKIILTITERTQKNTLGEAKFTRLKKIAESAQKQCGRCWPIEITAPIKLTEVIHTQKNTQFYVADLLCVGADPSVRPSSNHNQPSSNHNQPSSNNQQPPPENGRPQLENGRPQGAAPTKTPAIIFVGPEGGFTDTERKLFLENEAHFKILGDTVLRTETAAIAAYLDFSR